MELPCHRQMADQRHLARHPRFRHRRTHLLHQRSGSLRIVILGRVGGRGLRERQGSATFAVAPGAAARLGKVPNSGVLLRVNGEPRPIPRALESQLRAGDAGDLYGFWGMTLDGDAARRREKKADPMLGDMVGFTKAEAAEKPEGEWNLYEITVDGPAVVVHVNGKKVNEAKAATVLPGRIGLQSEGGEIHFRRVELLPLGR